MKPIIHISHFVANGCSFTYGDGLDDPRNEAWPALVAQKFNVPIVSLACGGTSNDRIYRTTSDYLFKDFGTNPFYLIGLTSMYRREEYMEFANGHIPMQLAHSISNVNVANFIKILTENSNDNALALRKVNIWLSIINLFKSLNKNYTIIDMIPFSMLEQNYIKDNFSNLYNYIFDDPNYIKHYNNFSPNFGRLPCGHHNFEGKQCAADIVYEHITSRFEVIAEKDQKYLATKDFYKPEELQHMQGRTAWL